MTAATVRDLPSLYVAFSPRTGSVRWFEVDAATEQSLADDLTQVDADEVRRVYRRLDGQWFAYLCHRAKPEQWAPIRARMIELRSAELVARAEALSVPSYYALPELMR